MTDEYSEFWGGTSVGDATLAPYDDNEFSEFVSSFVGFDRTIHGVVFGADNNLEITNPAGLSIQVDTGVAFVDGKRYVNPTAFNLTLSAAPGSGTDYYHVVLHKDYTAQTVRALLVGPVNGGPATPAVQVDGTTWEIVLAEIRQTSGGTITIYDKRMPTQPFVHLETQELIGSAASIIFTGIPNYFSKLILHVDISGGAGSAGLHLRLNGDIGTNYRWLTQHMTFAEVEVIDSGSAVSAIQLADVGSPSPETRFTGKIEIYNPVAEGSVVNTPLFWELMETLQAGATIRGSGRFSSAGAKVSSISIYAETGNLSTTKISLFGVIP